MKRAVAANKKPGTRTSRNLKTQNSKIFAKIRGEGPDTLSRTIFFSLEIFVFWNDKLILGITTDKFAVKARYK